MSTTPLPERSASSQSDLTKDRDSSLLPGENVLDDGRGDEDFWNDSDNDFPLEEGVDSEPEDDVGYEAPADLPPPEFPREEESTPNSGSSCKDNPTGISSSESTQGGETVSRFFAFLNNKQRLLAMKTPLYPKCRWCFTYGNPCYRDRPDQACRDCVLKKRKCDNDLTGAEVPP
jgi:hypothetical protein